MFVDAAIFYEVLERCPDLFPEWKKEGDKYWNSETGYIVYKGGAIAHDAIYRGWKYDNISKTITSKTINGGKCPEWKITGEYLNYEFYN